MKKLTTTGFILFFIIIPLAVLIRLPGLFYPLPFSGDALVYLNKAMKFGTGDFNPHYFTHPALSFYITFFAEGVLFVFSYLLGFVHSANDFTAIFFSNKLPFLVAGRVPSLLFGIGTIYLVYLIGKRIWSNESALCASIMLTLTPLHIIESQTIRIRSIATFFGMLFLLFVFNILKKGRKRDYVLAGLSLGLALATEYTMIFFAFPLLVVIVIRLLNQNLDKDDGCISPKIGLLLVCIAALAVFVVCSPYTLFDYPANVNSIMGNMDLGMVQTQTLNPDTIKTNHVVVVAESVYIMRLYQQIALLFSVEYTMGKMLAMVSMAGVLFAIYKRDEKDIVLLSLLSGFFVVQPLLVFPIPRMIVMAYPVLYLLAARVLINSIEKVFLHEKVQKWVFCLLIIVFAIPNIAWSMKHNKQLLQKDTRLMAKDWIEENIPAGSDILIEAFMLSNLIPLNESKESLLRKYLRYKSIIDKIPNYKGHSLRRKEIEMKNIKEPAYNINYFYTPSLKKELLDEFSSYAITPGALSIDEYQKKGVDYIVIARYRPSDDFSTEEYKIKRPDFHNLFKSLDQKCKLMKVFHYENSLEESRIPHINPEIKIYSLNQN